MSKYLITGGTGFLGTSLVRALLKNGHDIRLLDNDLRGFSERLSDISNHIEIIKADIRDCDKVFKSCKSIDKVCHLAYLNGTEFFYEKPDLVLDIGVKGMINIIDGCIKSGVKEFILASSSEVYQTPQVIPTNEEVPLSVPDPLNPRYSYGGGKIISELMAINYGRKYFDRVVIFRPHNVYGPDMGWEHVIPQFILRMYEICNNNSNNVIDFPVQGTGKETRSFVYIDDFIKGLMVVIEKGLHLGIYHIGTMDEITIEELAREMGNYFGKNINILPGKLREGGTLRRCPDISKLMNLGYKPEISLKEGLKYTIKWYIDNLNKKPHKVII